jgi:hypothetical protein
LEPRFKYGVLGAGAVGKSLIGKLLASARELGPVSSVSFRVASRIANTLRAGYPVRIAHELNDAAVILFHASPDQALILVAMLEKAEIQWAGRSLIFCDTDDVPAARAHFEAVGASIAVARQFGIPGHIAVEGKGAALHAAHRIAQSLKLKAVEILPGATALFDAAVTLGHGAITPLIDWTASMLRDAGVRDAEAARIAAALFMQTASDYAHSGKQSWAWHMRGPDVDRIEAQVAAAGERLRPVLRRLLLFGFDTFDKHPEIDAALKAHWARSKV